MVPSNERRSSRVKQETGKVGFMFVALLHGGCDNGLAMRNFGSIKSPVIGSLLLPALFLILAVSSFSLDCPKQPEQVSKDWQTQVDLSVAKISRVTGGELKVETKGVTQDLLGKLPAADRVYLEQMMFASYCSALRDAKTISDEEKARRIKIYNAEVRRTITQQSSKSSAKSAPKTSGPSSPPRSPSQQQDSSRGMSSQQTVIGNGNTTIGNITQGGNSVLSVNQQGGITARTVNIGPPPLPTPTVKVCATYPDRVAEENYKTIITFTTSSQLPRPWFALFFDGPVLEGSVGRTKGSYGYNHGRADKLPNPETSFTFRTIGIELGGTSNWFPSDGPIQATVPSPSRVKLIRVLAGGGDDPDAVFNVNLIFSCD